MKKWIGIGLLVISLIYSIEFYIEISLSFAIFIIAFEICKLILLRQDQTFKVKLIVFTCSMFVIFGFVANTVNKLEISNLKQYKKITNEAYVKYIEDKKLLENQVEEAKNQINNYPSFESLGLTKWEDKTEAYNNWNNQKSILNDNYNKLIIDLNKLKKPVQFKTVKIKNTGFNNLFKTLNLDKNGIYVLSLIIALIMELLQYEFMKNKTCKIKKLGTMKKYRLGTLKKLGTQKVRYKKLGTEQKKLGTKLGTDLENSGFNEKLGTEVRDELKEVRNRKKVENEKLGTEVKNELINEIESYIIENFNIDDFIKTNNLKKDLNITERQWKQLDKKLIRNINKIGTKFKRII